jgi:hypothetical protein
MGSFSVWHWLIVLVIELLWVAPLWRLLQCIGHPVGFALFGFFPPLGVVLLWWIAFSRWSRAAGPDRATFD